MLDILGGQADAGIIRIYTGAKPATPETAASGTLLAELTLNADAFGAAAAGTITANAITSDSAANATGTAGWFRVWKSDGTTPLWDGDVTATGGGGDMTLNTISIVANAQVSMTSCTYTVPM